METLLFILTVLVFGVGTALVAYTVILGAATEVEEELFNKSSNLNRKTTENVDFFFSSKEENN